MDESTLRIAVASEDLTGLTAGVGQHFGRCPAYTLVDVAEDGITRTESIENPYLAGHGPGEVPTFIRDMGAQVLLTGGIGGRAIAAFQEYGIQVSAGHTASVADAVEAWLAGDAAGPQPCTGHGHKHGHERQHGNHHRHGPGQGCGGGR